MRWPGYRHVFFDCDSTLTAVEGIDVLAELTGQKDSVAALTQAAMDGHIDLDDVYDERLRHANPTRRQVQEIFRVYRRNAVEDAAAVIAALHSLDISTYIVSGGLAEPVIEFGLHLGIPRENIRAVRVSYDELSGSWWENSLPGAPRHVSDRYLDYTPDGLTVSEGKAGVVRQLMGQHRGRSLLVGDGYSDLCAGGAVDLFVGFGGVVKRESVLAKASIYVHSKSLAPVLALAVGPAALISLQFGKHRDIAARTLAIIRQGAITFRDDKLKERFSRALTAALNAPH